MKTYLFVATGQTAPIKIVAATLGQAVRILVQIHGLKHYRMTGVAE